MKFNLRSLPTLKLPQKFALLGLIALVLVAVPFYEFYASTEKDVVFAKTELSGVQPAREAIRLIQLVQRHRDLSSRFLGGDDSVSNEREVAVAEINKLLQSLNDKIKNAKDKRIAKDFRDSNVYWRDTEDNVATRNYEMGMSFVAHSDLIGQYYAWLGNLLDYYKLSLDRDAYTYWLIQGGLNALPMATESFSQARALGSVSLLGFEKIRASGRPVESGLTQAEMLKLTVLLEQGEQRAARAFAEMERSFSLDETIKKGVGKQLEEVKEAVAVMNSLTRTEIVNPHIPELSSSSYYTSQSESIDRLYNLSDLSANILAQQLGGKIKALRSYQIKVLGSILLMVIIGVLLSILIIRGVTRPMNHLQAVVKKLREGETDVRARIETRDEIGELAQQFDRMMDEREATQAAIELENAQLNESVLGLLQAVAQLSQKDLTVKVPVAKDVTGAVADALNLLTDETGKVLAEVSEISAEVTNASLKVKEQADLVIEAAETEHDQIKHTAESLSDAAKRMNQIADLAKVCNTAADNAIRTTQRALETVTNTVGGINNTRDTIRETEKRIKRLGERSQEISGVVSLINTIAERTHILALNASMHAASAGEAGRGFAVVADEVQRLAENARQATAQIATLVSNIQVETSDTVNAMNAAISQVVEGSKLAEQAGEQMQQTQASTAELVEMVQLIAESSEAQARISNELMSRAAEISKSTEDTRAKLKVAGEHTASLVEYAKNLIRSVRVFRLPA